MLSIADIPLGVLNFTGIIGVIHYRGREYRLATYLGARVVCAKDGEAVVLRTIADATLTISNADGIKVVANNGTEYVADANGKITVVITANQNFTVTYDGEDAERAIYFTFVEYFG